MKRADVIELINSCLVNKEPAEVIVGCLEEVGVISFTNDIVGMVTWEKIEGESSYRSRAMILKGDTGFGTLFRYPIVGDSMRIVGDFGVVTSVVKSIKVVNDDELDVTTRNSVYKVKRMK